MRFARNCCMVRGPVSKEDVKLVDEGAWNRLRPRIYLVATSCDQEVPPHASIGRVRTRFRRGIRDARCGGAQQPASAAPLKILAANVLQELNRVREAHGLRPLRASPSLAASARATRPQMGRRGFFAHESPDGTPFWRRIERFYVDDGFRSWRSERTSSGSRRRRRRRFRSFAPGSPRPAIARTSSRAAGARPASVRSACRARRGVPRCAPVTIVTVDFGKRDR